MNRNLLGFTLIELLVVIAIIGVFSSVVLASVQDVRLSAETTANNQIVRQYITALEQVRSQTGSYPAPQPPPLGAGVAPIYVCLADFADDSCGTENDNSEYPLMINQLSETYPSLPTHKSVEMFTLGGWLTWEGPVYACSEYGASGNTCSAYIIIWTHRGENQTCLGTDPYWSFRGVSWCRHRSQ